MVRDAESRINGFGEREMERRRCVVWVNVDVKKRGVRGAAREGWVRRSERMDGRGRWVLIWWRSSVGRVRSDMVRIYQPRVRFSLGGMRGIKEAFIECEAASVSFVTRIQRDEIGISLRSLYESVVVVVIRYDS